MPQAPRHDPAGPMSRGNLPATDNLDPVEQPDTSPPDWLTKDALPAWRAAVDLLTRVRIVAKSDLTALARYCQLLAEWIILTDDIMVSGHTVADRFQQQKLNPSVQARDAIERSIRALEKALGLDPSSYMDLTRDLAKQTQQRGKVRNGRGVGGFLNKGKPPGGA